MEDNPFSWIPYPMQTLFQGWVSIVWMGSQEVDSSNSNPVTLDNWSYTVGGWGQKPGELYSWWNYYLHLAGEAPPSLLSHQISGFKMANRGEHCLEHPLGEISLDGIQMETYPHIDFRFSEVSKTFLYIML